MPRTLLAPALEQAGVMQRAHVVGFAIGLFLVDEEDEAKLAAGGWAFQCQCAAEFEKRCDAGAVVVGTGQPGAES